MNVSFRLLLATLMILLVGELQIALAQRSLTDIPKPDPSAELAAMMVAEGYEVNLFAADPMIRKPLQMNFDPQGRLWVSSSSVYPQIQPGEVANDMVTILEDRDGDGCAEIHTTFADGLLMPTAVLPGDGGCYVANSTEILHLTDRNGDGKADDRRVVFTGFGAEDTHHIIHTFRWGPDARMFFNQSIYIHSHVETPHGVKRLNGGGIWRFLPRSLALDVYARGWVNTWGHAFDYWDRSLVTDGAGSEGIYYGFPGAAYSGAAGIPRRLHGMNPGSPKYCGLEIVDGSHLPENAQGTLLTNDFRANRVCRFQLTEEGSGFSSKQLPDLIRSKRVTFRPIDIKLGPDGAIYIADWYNPIIQHGEVDFRDPRRDREHGRIWRVIAKGRPLSPRVDFTKQSIPDLLEDLITQSAYGRDMARRTLWKREPTAVRTAVNAWLDTLDQSMTNFERLQLEGLRLLQAIDRGSIQDVDLSLLTEVLRSSDPRARAAAARIVVDWADRIEDPVGLLAPTVTDDSMLVRLEGVRALATIRGSQAATLVLRAVDQPRDDALDYAIWLACRELQNDWLPEVISNKSPIIAHPKQLLFAIEATAATKAIPAVVQLLQSDSLPSDERTAILDCIAQYGGPDELKIAFDVAVDQKTSPAQTTRLIGHLLESHSRRQVQPTEPLSKLGLLIKSPNLNVAKAAIKAAGHWQVTTTIKSLAQLTSDTKQPTALRLSAIETLGRFPRAVSVTMPLRKLISNAATPVPVRIAAMASLLNQQPQEAATVAVNFLAGQMTESDRTAVFKVFLSRRGSPAALAAAIKAFDGLLPKGVATIGLQQLASSGRVEPLLKATLEKVQSHHQQRPEKSGFSAIQMEEFLTFVEKAGSGTRGQDIYRREKMQCVKCHRIGREGGKIGPNLSTIGVASQPDYIVNSLLEPAKNVKEGYNTLVILTVDGQVATGIPVSRTESELVLRTADNKQLNIRVDNIDEESVGTSLMPVGLVDQLSRQELADLTRYLISLGKEGL